MSQDNDKERLELSTGSAPAKRAGDGEVKRSPPLRAIAPESPGRGPLVKLFFVLLLGIGVYGAYYGYCKYKVNNRSYALSREAMDLHQALMRLTHDIDEEDVRQVVIAMARKAGVQPDHRSLQIVIEPMTDETMKKLPSVAQMGMNIAGKIPGGNKPKWVVGFKGRFYAKHGVASGYFEAERYTWFLHVKPVAEEP